MLSLHASWVVFPSVIQFICTRVEGGAPRAHEPPAPEGLVDERDDRMGIKLRVRVEGEADVRRLEVPETCTLAQLRRHVLAKCLTTGDSAGHDDAQLADPSEVAVTLNRVDDVGAEAAESATLRACGIARGDTLHVFRRRSDGGTGGPEEPATTKIEQRCQPPSDVGHLSGSGGVSSASSSRASEPAGGVYARMETAEERRRRCILAVERRAAARGSCAASPAPRAEPEPPRDAPEVDDASTPAEVDAAFTDTEVSASQSRDVDYPDSLVRVMAAEARARTSAGASPSSPAVESSTAVELLLMAVHALFLEVGFTPVHGNDATPGATQTCALPSGWRSSEASTGCYRLRYAVGVRVSGADVTCTIRAQSFGDAHVVLLGCADGHQGERAGDGSKNEVHRLTVAIADHVTRSDEGTMQVTGLRRLWARGKDAMANRLKSDLCRASGLPPPPALLTLPDELKLRCFAGLPASDLGAVSCASVELRYIAAADDLWRPLYLAEFGEEDDGGMHAGTVERDVNGHGSARGFKRAYAEKIRKRRALREARRRWEEEQARRRLEPPLQPAPHPSHPGVFFPQPGGYVPGITGGDYDIYPNFGGPMPGFPGSGGGGLGGPGGGFPRFGGGNWPGVMPGGMPGGVPTPTPGVGLGGRGLGRFPGSGGRRGQGRGGGAPVPGWDGRPRPPDFDGDFI